MPELECGNVSVVQQNVEQLERPEMNMAAKLIRREDSCQHNANYFWAGILMQNSRVNAACMKNYLRFENIISIILPFCAIPPYQRCRY